MAPATVMKYEKLLKTIKKLIHHEISSKLIKKKGILALVKVYGTLSDSHF